MRFRSRLEIAKMIDSTIVWGNHEINKYMAYLLHRARQANNSGWNSNIFNFLVTSVEK